VRDTSGFDAFYAGTSRRVLHQMYAMTGNLADAQDLVQEAYARAWQRWSSVSTYDDPEAWVRKVGYRLGVSRWRKARNRLAAHRRHGPDAWAAPPSENTVAVVAPPPARQEARPSRLGLWVAGGGGLALGVSAFFWYRAWDADHELDQLFADGGVYDDHYQGLADRIDTSRTLAIVTGAVGVAAVAGGLVYHLALRRRAEADAPQAAALVTPDSAMLVVGCGF